MANPTPSEYIHHPCRFECLLPALKTQEGGSDWPSGLEDRIGMLTEGAPSFQQ